MGSCAESSPDSAHFRLKAANLSVPSSFDVLEDARDASRIAGEYASAAKLQRELEKRKQEEGDKHLQVLADKHEVETQALERSQAAEYDQFAQHWDAQMANQQSQAEQQKASMMERHAREHDAFKQASESSMPKPKWSSDLLNSRKIEEHLARQREFEKAAKLKMKADEIEAEEIRRNEEAYWGKVALEEAKLLHKQSRELDALNTKTTAMHDEALVQQRRKLNMMSKKFQVARIELSKAQGMERSDLELALKGWFNTRKFGLGPSPLVPSSPMSVSLMSPGTKFGLHRTCEAYSSNRDSPQRSGQSSPSPKKAASSAPSEGCAEHAADGSASAGASECGSPITLPSIHSRPGSCDEAGALPRLLQPKSKAPGLTPLSMSGSRPGTGSGFGSGAPWSPSSGAVYAGKAVSLSPKVLPGSGASTPKDSIQAVH